MHPQVLPSLTRQGLEVWIEQGAGKAAGLSDEAFAQAGARIEPDPAKLWRTCTVILKVAAPAQRSDGVDEATWLRPDQVCIGLFDPLGNPTRVKHLAESGAALFAMELIPRVSRAQGMDANSSQANLAGYRAVILAAHHLHKVIPMMMTAGGTVQPARFLVVGAGVAGLQAIATAKRLGARVHAYDVRAAVKEQVESLGAKFVGIDLKQTFEGTGGYAKAVTTDALATQQQGLARVASGMDAVITTAQVPGG
ncbi:MAG: NAD(P)(+) transhydrogenase (Re/Si-specific) subunit alpha, partial [Myxococcota bacterium]